MDSPHAGGALAAESAARPGRDPSVPHQDLRIPRSTPSRYLSRALPSTNRSYTSQHVPRPQAQHDTTPAIAVQIASLHRAAEVARFEWRAQQRRPRGATAAVEHERQTREENMSYQPLPSAERAGDGEPPPSRVRASDPLGEAQAGPSSLSLSLSPQHSVDRRPDRDEAERRRSVTRIYSSTLDAYLSAARDLTPLSDINRSASGARSNNRHVPNNDDVSDDDDDDDDNDDDDDGDGDGDDALTLGETSDESSDSADDEVMAATLRPSHARRRESHERRSEQRSLPSETARAISTPPPASQYDNCNVESQVWDRMVGDLAIGAGIGNPTRAWDGIPGANSSTYPRGISGGIAASMLALSAAIPRPATTGASGSSSDGPHRLLPHPIWARRYPGAAGEWLRGELARRANAASQDQYGPPPGEARSSQSNTRSYATLTSLVERSFDDQNDRRYQRSRASANAYDEIFSNSMTRDRQSSRASATGSHSPWQWSMLRFPSLDPGGRTSTTAEASPTDVAPPATIRASTQTSNTLAVPSNATALAPTPPLHPVASPRLVVRDSELSPMQRSADQAEHDTQQDVGPTTRSQAATGPMVREGGAPSSRNEAARLVARMASLTRDRVAGHSPSSFGPRNSVTARTSSSGRAVQGGLEYIRHLRQLDGLEEGPGRNRSIAADSTIHFEEPESPPQPWQVFPWYAPPVENLCDHMRHSHLDDQQARQPRDGMSSNFDPDGSTTDWYQMARARMSAAADQNDDPNGEREDDDAATDGPSHEQALRVRRHVIAGSTSASQRLRNRSALVMADADSNNSNIRRGATSGGIEAWSAADGWTLVDQRPSSPVRDTRDEGSENVTTWFRGPAFSTSPVPLADSDEASTTRRTSADSLRLTRRPRRLGNLIADARHAAEDSIAGMSPGASPGTAQQQARLSPIPPAPQRRSELWGRSQRSEPAEPVSRTRYFRPFDRENTPSPEPQLRRTLSHARDAPQEGSSDDAEVSQSRPRSHQDMTHISNIGARLEQEFRARQDELREREEHLRAEVARRRLELDDLRRRQGRIGLIVERTRDNSGVQSPLVAQAGALARDESVLSAARLESHSPVASDGNEQPTGTSMPDDVFLDEGSQQQLEETVPLLGHTPASPSLVRRRALREPATAQSSMRRLEARRSMLAAPPTNGQSARRERPASRAPEADNVGISSSSSSNSRHFDSEDPSYALTSPSDSQRHAHYVAAPSQNSATPRAMIAEEGTAAQVTHRRRANSWSAPRSTLALYCDGQ